MDKIPFYAHRKNPLIGGACDGHVHEIPKELRNGDRFMMPHPIDKLTFEPLPMDVPPEMAVIKTELYRVLTLHVVDRETDPPHTFYIGVAAELTRSQAFAMLFSGYHKERTNGRT